MEVLTQFAATPTSGENQDIFSTLGIHWELLVLQIVAFLILVWLLGKFVYPWLMKNVDERQAKIEASVKAAEAAERKAESAQEDIAQLLKEARAEARDIVATAKDEATAMVEASDAKAKQRADKIVADAHDKIEKDVIAARKALHNDTIDLVALATEKVVGNLADAKLDKRLIESAVTEARK